MDGAHINPIFDRGYAVPVLTPHSTCYEPHSKPRAAVPPVIGEIIAKVGLRYKPTGTADLEAHAQMLLLLGEDCADMPPELLDAAAKKWARESRFMPRASELRDTARAIQSESIRSTDFALQQLQAHCDTQNESEARMGSHQRWRVVGQAPRREVAPYRIGEAA